MTRILTPTAEHDVATRDGLWMSPADAETVTSPGEVTFAHDRHEGDHAGIAGRKAAREARAVGC